MLDLDYVVNNIDLVVKKLNTRNDDFSYLKELVLLSKKRKDLILKGDELKAKKNKVSQEIGQYKREGKDISKILAEIDNFKDDILKIDSELDLLNKKIREILLKTPNIPDDDLPVGKSDLDNLEVKKWGKIKEFDFPVKDHYEICENLGILDFKRAVKVSAPRFTYDIGLGARLERALINFMFDTHIKKGYTEAIPPYMVNSDSMYGTGQFPKFIGDSFKVEGQDLYLNPTAEVPMINYYRDEILKGSELPKKFVAYSTAFRQEAGSAGKDTRGIIRQHQFHKVELIKFTRPEDSEKELKDMLKASEDILKLLKLPYRVVLLSTGDLGFSMCKTYDIEVWLPGQNKYREIASISNARDYQARRAQIRFKDQKDDKTRFVHTLNGSGLAVGRTLVAICENYQTKEGFIKVPTVLIPYMNGVKIIKK